MPLKSKKIEKALAESSRFIEAALKAKSRIEKEEHVWPSKESATMKRASMDLTRSLSELRG